MLSTEPAQAIAIRKIWPRDKDFVGIFPPWNLEMLWVKRQPDRIYSASLKECYIPDSMSHEEALLELFSVDKTEYPLFLLEQTNNRTISDAMTKDDHTGISSSGEELSAFASITSKPEAADLQENGENGLQITFSSQQLIVCMLNNSSDSTFLTSQSGPNWNLIHRNRALTFSSIR